MSDNNYSNRTLRTLFPSLASTHEVDFSDVYLQTNLVNDFQMTGNTLPVVPARILYPAAADNGYYSVDGGGSIFITKKGLYSVHYTATFSAFGGSCQHYIQFDINGFGYKFGEDNTVNSNLDPATTNFNSMLTGSTTIALKPGDIIEHYAAGWINPPGATVFDIIGSNTSVNYTNIRLIYLSQP